ncbi:hypothetical protein [Mycoplasma sp. 1018B]|uniref:hypothetical protein n=1 Tax=Mycoplasma sp. 1018B TaxID=2967302 RepID=UPI00211B77D5|nr:hypothetical protein [Mycoplasma sp. 1018B]UUM19390.1 hypothetical protein NPA14_00755 [Mycoplasma sp. 1018B]
MKKLSKIIKCFLTLNLLPTFLLTSVACFNVNKEKNILTNNWEFTPKFIDTVDNNLLDLTKKFIPNQSEFNDFIDVQSQIDNNLINELNFSLIFAPLQDVKVLSNSGNQNKKTNQSISNLKQFLKNNWFWYLNNLEKLIFAFNPYGKDYDISFNNKVDNFNELLKQKINDNTLLFKFNNKTIDKIITKTFNLNEHDKLLNKKLFFIVLEQNKIMLLLSYEENQKKNIIILPDLFVISDINYLDTFIENFLLFFQEEWTKNLEKNINYLKSIDDDFDVNNYLAINNDSKLFSFYDSDNYAEIFSNLVLNFQTKNITIEKYIWSYIDDQKNY